MNIKTYALITLCLATTTIHTMEDVELNDLTNINTKQSPSISDTEETRNKWLKEHKDLIRMILNLSAQPILKIKDSNQPVHWYENILYMYRRFEETNWKIAFNKQGDRFLILSQCYQLGNQDNTSNIRSFDFNGNLKSETVNKLLYNKIPWTEEVVEDNCDKNMLIYLGMNQSGWSTTYYQDKLATIDNQNEVVVFDLKKYHHNKTFLENEITPAQIDLLNTLKLKRMRKHWTISLDNTPDQQKIFDSLPLHLKNILAPTSEEQIKKVIFRVDVHKNKLSYHCTDSTSRQIATVKALQSRFEIPTKYIEEE